MRAFARAMSTKIITAPDTETELIRPARCAPPLVCVTVHHSDEDAPRIYHQSDPALERTLGDWFEDAAAGRRVIVGHNFAFDAAVLCERFPDLRPAIFRAYENDGVTDTLIRAWLLDTAAGRLRGYMRGPIWQPIRYDLESQARGIGMHLQKDAWRMSYGYFINNPLSQWPARAQEVQGIMSARLPERQALLAKLEAAPKAKRAKGVDAAITALKKEIEGLKDAIASDPSRATEYPLEDATATLRLYQAQEENAEAYLADQYRQAHAYFALYLQSVWGFRTDAAGIEVIDREITFELEELKAELIEEGLVRENGTRDTKAAKERMIEACRKGGVHVIRTDGHIDDDHPCPSQCSCGKEGRCRNMGRVPGHTDIYEDFDHPEFCREHVSLDKDACEAVAEFDPTIGSYAEFTTLAKVKSNDLVQLAGGVVYPVHTRYGWAGTGRCTSSGPNIQNQSKRDGIREAFLARDGYVFIECDYPQLELYTLAQCCVSWFGYSKLAEVLLAGKDPHTMMAGTILRLPYEDTLRILKDERHEKHGLVAKVRQQSKPVNFGRPGGMGAETLMKTARKQMGRKAFAKLGMDLKRAEELCGYWEATWPEMKPYFARVKEMINDGEGRASVETLFTGRWRGNATFCATANNGFQALGADCAKNAVWEVAKASYVVTESPLFNTRPNGFVHDEILAETPYQPDERGIDRKAHAAAFELGRLMAVGANRFLPDVPIDVARMEPVMMRRWWKAATSLFVDDQGTVHKKPGEGRWLVPAKVEYDASSDQKIVVRDWTAAA